MKTFSLQRYALSETNRRDAQRVFEDLSRETASERFVRDAFVATVRTLPGEAIGLLKGFETGALLIQNLPVDAALPPTPRSPEEASRVLLPVATASLLGSAQLVGEPFSYRNEWNGDLVTHVVPLQASKDSVSSQGSSRALPFHSESIHLKEHAPSAVIMFCLKGDPRVATQVASAKKIVDALPAEIVETLRSPIFWVQPPQSYGNAGPTAGMMSVLAGPLSDPMIRAEFTDMRAITPAGVRALEVLAEVTGTVAEAVVLSAGDALYVDNRRWLHGRGGFDAALDGSDRWVMRVLARRADLWDWRELMSGPRQVAF